MVSMGSLRLLLLRLLLIVARLLTVQVNIGTEQVYMYNLWVACPRAYSDLNLFLNKSLSCAKRWNMSAQSRVGRVLGLLTP